MAQAATPAIFSSRPRAKAGLDMQPGAQDEMVADVFGIDGHEWHSFLIEKKLPKSWSKKIKNDVMYGFKRNEKDE